MGILVGLPRTGGSEKDLQLNFGKVADQQMEVRKPFLPLSGILKAEYN